MKAEWWVGRPLWVASWAHAGHCELGVRKTWMGDNRRMVDGQVKLYVRDRLMSCFALGPQTVWVGHTVWAASGTSHGHCHVDCEAVAPLAWKG